MRIKTEELREAYRVVAAVPVVPGIASSEYLRLVCANGVLRLSLTGHIAGNTGVPCANPQEGWKFYAERALFGRFLANAGGEFVEATPNADGLVLKSGRSRVKLAGRDSCSGYTRWKPGKEEPWVLGAKQVRVSRFLAQYCSVVPAMPNSGSVCVQGGLYMALDVAGTALASVSLGEANGAVRHIPGTLLTLKATPDKVVATSGGAAGQFGVGHLYQPLSKEAEEFPFKKAMAVVERAMAVESRVRVKAKDLLNAVKELLGYNCQVATVGCNSDGKRLVLDAKQGTTECTTSRPAKWGKAPSGKWSVVLQPLVPWLDFIAEQDGSIECARGEGETVLRAPCKVGKKVGKALLVVVDVEA